MGGWDVSPFPLCHPDFHLGNILVDDDFHITGIIDWSDAQTVSVERFMITPEFATFPGADEYVDARIRGFRKDFRKALRAREIAANPEVEAEGRLLMSDLIETSRWEIVYRCNYSFHWRAVTDVKYFVLKEMYGEEAEWEDVVAFYRNAPMHTKVLGE